MINKVKIRSGELKKVLPITNVKFDPGLTIIWGKNGVGKSFLLKTIAKYCAVSCHGNGGGWTEPPIGFNYSYWNRDEKINLSDVYEFDEDSKLNIDWSGDPTFYMHHDDMIDWHHITGYMMGGSEWIKGIGDIWNKIIKEKHKHHPSSGQMIKGVIELLMDIDPPNLEADDRSRMRNDFPEYIKKRKEVFKGEFKPTIILDETDSQLDLMNQIWFHEEVIPKLLEKYQVILASHSILSIRYENVIDLDGSLPIIKEKAKELLNL